MSKKRTYGKSNESDYFPQRGSSSSSSSSSSSFATGTENHEDDSDDIVDSQEENYTVYGKRNEIEIVGGSDRRSSDLPHVGASSGIGTDVRSRTRRSVSPAKRRSKKQTGKSNSVNLQTQNSTSASPLAGGDGTSPASVKVMNPDSTEVIINEIMKKNNVLGLDDYSKILTYYRTADRAFQLDREEHERFIAFTIAFSGEVISRLSRGRREIHVMKLCWKDYDLSFIPNVMLGSTVAKTADIENPLSLVGLAQRINMWLVERGIPPTISALQFTHGDERYKTFQCSDGSVNVNEVCSIMTVSLPYVKPMTSNPLTSLYRVEPQFYIIGDSSV